MCADGPLTATQAARQAAVSRHSVNRPGIDLM